MKANEIRELLRLMADEMAMIWSNTGFTNDVRNAVTNGGSAEELQALLRRTWAKSWYWMPELNDRVAAALA